VRTFNVVIEYDLKTNLYVGYVPGWPGAYSQGATLDERSTRAPSSGSVVDSTPTRVTRSA